MMKNGQKLAKAGKVLGAHARCWRANMTSAPCCLPCRLMFHRSVEDSNLQADWLLELRGAPLRHVRRFVVDLSSSMFLRIFRIFDSPNWQKFTNSDRLCGRLPFEIEGTSRSQLHVDVRVSFGGVSLAKTQHRRLKFFSSRSRLWINRIWISSTVRWKKAGGVADIKRITRERLSPQGVGTSEVLHQV